MYVCICNAVTDRQIVAAVDAGHTSLKALRAELGVAAECGRCARCAMDLIKSCRGCGQCGKDHDCASDDAALAGAANLLPGERSKKLHSLGGPASRAALTERIAA